jgi:hypothetical protein
MLAAEFARDAGPGEKAGGKGERNALDGEFEFKVNLIQILCLCTAIYRQTSENHYHLGPKPA